MTNVWTPFYWSDWANDPALRVCSLAAQGLWMRMLCVAAESNPTGYVTIAGRPLSHSDLAKIAGVSESDVELLIAELDRNGVFSRDAKGRIFCRRMVRDAKKRQTAQKNGKKGGNPSLCKTRRNSRWVNPPLNPEDNPHIPYTIYQNIPVDVLNEHQQGADAPADLPRMTIAAGASSPEEFKPPDRRVRSVQAAPTPAEPASAEDEFWRVVGESSASGQLPKSLMAKAVKVYDGDFEMALATVRSALKARDPVRYLGRVLSSVQQERAVGPRAAPSDDLPEFVREFVREGYHPERRKDGTWRIGGSIYDARGEVVGW